MDDFYLAGWRVRSEFGIAGLARWDGEERLPDIVLRSGVIPEPHSSLMVDGPVLKIARDGSCWCAMPFAGRVLVNSDATEVTVAAANSADPAKTAFASRAILGILCHKRGLLPIHASCVEIGGRAIAFAGPSAAGKSVLAAALMKAGCTILADDITVIDTAAAGGPAVLQSFPQPRLWRDSLEALGFDQKRARRLRPEIEKYDLSSYRASATEPRQLAAIYHLRREPKISTSIKGLHAVGAVQYAGAAISQLPAAGVLVDEATRFHAIARVCASVPSYLLGYRPGFDVLPATLAAVVTRHGERL